MDLQAADYLDAAAGEYPKMKSLDLPSKMQTGGCCQIDLGFSSWGIFQQQHQGSVRLEGLGCSFSG